MNWNVIFAHAWPESYYRLGVDYLRDGTTNGMPRSLIRRFRTVPYRLNEQNEIILTVMHAPWTVNRNNKVMLMESNEPYVFKVIRESDRESILNSFLDDPKSVGLNAHTLLDKVFRQGYLGISRRYIQLYLTNNPRAANIRMIKSDMSKPIVKSFRPEYPFQHWQMDLIDYSKLHRENKGFKYIFVIMDIFTKFVYLYPLKFKGLVTDGRNDIPYILNKLFLTGDIPDILHSDQGTEFRNRTVHEVCVEFGVKQIFGKPYSPQTQGFVENKNKHIKAMVNAYFTKYGQATWYAILDRIAYTINNAKHFVTGYTPMQLHRGRDVNKSYRVIVSDTEYEANVEFVFDENTVHEYQSKTQCLYDRRVTHVSNVLKSEATKRELIHNKKNAESAEIRQGSIVRVATYVRTSGKIQGILIKIGDRVIENPLKYTRDKVSRHLADLETRPETMFSKPQLRVKKYYPHLFRVNGVHRIDNVVRYNLVEYNPDKPSEQARERVYLKVANEFQTMTNIYPEQRVWDDRFRKSYLLALNPLEFNRYVNIPYAQRPHVLSMIDVDYLNLTDQQQSQQPHESQAPSDTLLFWGRTPMKVVKVPGDGNCMFHSVITGLRLIGRSIPYDDHKHLRQETVRRNVEQCIESPNHLQILSASNDRTHDKEFQSCDEYKTHMSMLGTWAGDAELSQIQNILYENEIILHVYELNARKKLISVVGYDRVSSSPMSVVRILRVNRIHYDVLSEMQQQGNHRTNPNSTTNNGPGGEELQELTNNNPCTIEFMVGPQFRKKLVKQHIWYTWLLNKKPKEYEGQIKKYIGPKVQKEGPFAGKRMGNFFEIRGVVENDGQVTRHDLELRPELYNKPVPDGWRFADESTVFRKCKRFLKSARSK